MNKLEKIFLYVIFSPILFFIYIIILITRIRKTRCQKNCLKHLNIEILDKLDSCSFEKLVSLFFEAKGFRVKTKLCFCKDTHALIAWRNNKKYLIQITPSTQRLISNEVVLKVFSAKANLNCDHGLIITNLFYSNYAISTANKLGITLLNRNDIIEIINSINKKTTCDPIKHLII